MVFSKNSPRATECLWGKKYTTLYYSQKLIQDLNLIGKLKFLKENRHHHSRIAGALTIQRNMGEDNIEVYRRQRLEGGDYGDKCFWVCVEEASPCQASKAGQGVSKIVAKKSRCKSQNQEEAVSCPILYTHSAAGKMEPWHLPAQGPWCTQGMTQAQPYPSHHITLQAHLGQMLL